MAFAFESTYLDWPLVPGRAWDLFRPPSLEAPVAVFFIHGGGWTAGGRAGAHRIMSPLTEAGFITGSTDYRLQRVRITDQLADVRAACAAFRVRLREINGAPQRVVVYGESAGAHLALLLAFAQPGACGEELPETGPEAELVREPLAGAAVQSAPTTFEPWEEIFPHAWTAMQAIVGEPYSESPELYQAASPIQHVKPGCPPVFLMEAENEHMFPRELNERFAAAVRSVGSRAELKVYPRAEHGFFYEISRRCQQEALADLLAFARTCA